MFIPKFSESEITNVLNKLTPSKSRAANNNILLSSNNTTYSGDYYGYSLKRTNLSNCIFRNAIFDHTSFAGSIINQIKFESDCKFESVFFEQSILSSVSFESNLKIDGCNFSHSFIKDSSFNSCQIRSTYFNNCHLINCVFSNCIIRSTMFDSAYLVGCDFINCNMRNLNIEFATLEKCSLSGTAFSYFQLPYIIGIFKDLPQDIYVGKNDGNPIPIKQYLSEIDDSIVYFTYLEEYFPLVNLYYAKEEIEIAKSCLDVGINKALLSNDIRMVENYCKLGQYYELLAIKDIQCILKKVDESIEKERNTPFFSILLSKSFQLKASIDNNYSKSKLEIIINTNITKDRFNDVSQLCEEIDTIIIGLMPNRISTTYQLRHNSPFEICLTCIGLTSDLIGISGLIYALLRKRLSKKSKLPSQIEDYISKKNKNYIESLNVQFDLFEKVMTTINKTKQAEIIDDFRSKIITSVTNQLNDDFALIIAESNQ